MATYTSNYGWTKPSGSDNVDISVLNDNLDNQDRTIHDAFLNMAPPFSESSTYAVDDIVLYGTGLYKCHTAVVTPGSWTGSTNWQVYKLSEGGSGGGGTSNYNQLSNKPQINSVELSGNKTSSQLGLMASDGVVANPTGQTTGSLTALEVGGTKYAVPSGGTSDYTALTNKPSINGVTLSGNKTTSDLGIDKTAVGLGNVPNVSTNDQTPTFSQASTRNNIASGEKLSVILGKVQKFFNDLKTVAYSGSYTDLTNTPSLANVATSGSYADVSNKPQINSVELSGNKTTSDLGINADNVMMSDGVTSVEDALDDMNKPSGSGAANRLAFREEITEITDEMWASIADGTFDKVHVGMHYTAASGRKYWFADADYYWGKSVPEQTSHHMLVVEDEISHIAQHQTTTVTTGGAIDSLIYTNTLPRIQSELNADFGESHILTQSLYLTNAISNNVASSGAYIDKKAALLNICQVMGHGLGYTEGTGQYLNAMLRERQLSLFQAMPETIVARDKTTQERTWYWCDDVINGSSFGIVSYSGNDYYISASGTGGVRRAFLIG